MSSWSNRIGRSCLALTFNVMPRWETQALLPSHPMVMEGLCQRHAHWACRLETPRH